MSIETRSKLTRSLSVWILGAAVVGLMYAVVAVLAMAAAVVGQ